jgi:hypothetical protein
MTLENQGTIRLRSQPADLTDRDVKNMLKKYNFYSKDIGWNKDFSDDSGEFKNDLHDNTDGTITDRATGLIWQQGSAPHYMTWNDAKLYIETLNKEKFAGHSDWRLPTIEEFASLIERENLNHGLYIDPMFSDRMWFWSIDTRGTDSGEVWTANFHYGAIYKLETTQGQDVKAVRSLPAITPVLEVDEGFIRLRSEPADLTESEVENLLKKHGFFSKEIEVNKSFCNDSGDFKNGFHDNGDNTVTDRATGLMWQQSSAPHYMRWNDAKLYIEKMNKERFAGYSDWRLPTVEEFASLMERENLNHGLYIDPVFSDRMWFWSIDSKGIDLDNDIQT